MPVRPSVTGLVLVVLCILPAPGLAQPGEYHEAWRLPDDPLGRTLGHLLEAFTRDNEGFSRDFIENRLHPSFLEMGPVEMHLEQFAAIRKQLGSFEVDDIRLQSPTQADVVLRSAAGTRTVLHVEIEERAPHRVAGIGLRPHDDDLEIPEFSEVGDVHGYLEKLADANKFSGVVLIEQPDADLFLRAYGMSNKETGVENSPETAFNVGSITKSFTATAVMQLVEQGRVGLDDPMSKYLSAFPQEIADKITVRQLLRMESGYGDYFDSPLFRERRTTIRTIDDMLDILKTFTLEFEPGAGSRYSNAGYVILGGIIERASGMSYFDFVQEYIFKPAKMTGSSFPEYGTEDDGIAMGYTNDGPEGPSGYTDRYLDFFTPLGNPSGGSFSTAADLLSFSRALRGNKLLSDENTTLLLNFFEEGKERPFRHGVAGGAPGVSAVSLEDAKRGISVIVLSNYDEPHGERIGQAVFKMLVGGS